MWLPIQLYTTPESYLVLKLSIPILFKRKMGWKYVGRVQRDRLFAPQFTCGEAEEKLCWWGYFINFYFRVRSNECMKQLDPAKNPKQIVWNFSVGWSQFSL